eukprot:scaffold78013_cov37-Tisochrysis_lutea.AAC.2
MQWRQSEGIPQLIATSPLTRAIQTVEIGFPNRTEDGAPRPPVVATSLARERISHHQCDRRRSVSELQDKFGSWVDFSEVSC